jgi:hypothetical protein
MERLRKRPEAVWKAVLHKVEADRGRLREGVYDLAIARLCRAIHLRGF